MIRLFYARCIQQPFTGYIFCHQWREKVPKCCPEQACKLQLCQELVLLQAKNEVKVLNSLNHPNIVKYYECYQERNMMHIIMEFCQVPPSPTCTSDKLVVLPDCSLEGCCHEHQAKAHACHTSKELR